MNADIDELNERTYRAYFRKEGNACSITKKGQESQVNGHSYGFLTLIFPNLRHLEHTTFPSMACVFGGLV